MKEAILAIDPGITTGWALLDSSGTILGTSVWGTAELSVSLDTLIRQAHLADYTLHAVIELMPQTGKMGHLGQKLEAVRRDVYRIVQEIYEIPVEEITPGEWKPSRTAKLTEIPRTFNDTPLMIHQKDAIRMGRYAIDKRQRTHVEWRSE